MRKMRNYVFFKSIDLLQITWSFIEFPWHGWGTVCINGRRTSSLSNLWISYNKCKIFDFKYFKHLMSNIKSLDFITMPSSLFLYVWFLWQLLCYMGRIVILYQIRHHHHMKMLGTLYKLFIVSVESDDLEEMFCENICLTF